MTLAKWQSWEHDLWWGIVKWGWPHTPFLGAMDPENPLSVGFTGLQTHLPISSASSSLHHQVSHTSSWRHHQEKQGCSQDPNKGVTLAIEVKYGKMTQKNHPSAYHWSIMGATLDLHRWNLLVRLKLSHPIAVESCTCGIGRPGGSV